MGDESLVDGFCFSMDADFFFFPSLGPAKLKNSIFLRLFSLQPAIMERLKVSDIFYLCQEEGFLGIVGLSFCLCT